MKIQKQEYTNTGTHPAKLTHSTVNTCQAEVTIVLFFETPKDSQTLIQL